ncbi:MAG TPA: ABC transporter ATP-binding protein [Anaerolineae bacterium]|nr:ABC transporter ATP-binding protein [Anaerolineae bacterium]
MTDIAVRVEKLSKRYRIGGPQARYRTLRESLVDMAAAPARRLRRLGQPSPENETIWALKDVTFDVKKGEVVGVIGRNGAGKTTLLRILSRITEPTEGYAEIRGRVGSLLEVGTGFHPELTGRENIYLNGAILGMKRTEINIKFDEIVAFSEIEKFLDTPVKRYSSGMYVRLAFSVAAHLEPEILLVDEVLAVGDASFQRKCLGKMGDVAHEGRTVLFVSHNMAAVSGLCERAMWIDDGKIVDIGPTDAVVREYLRVPAAATGTWTNVSSFDTAGDIRLQTAAIVTESGTQAGVVGFDEDFAVEILYEVQRRIPSWSLVFRITDSSGTAIFTSWDTDSEPGRQKPLDAGVYRAICRVPGRLVRPGIYSVSLATHIPNVRIIENHEHIFHFEVSTVGYGMNPGRWGAVTPVLEWRVKRILD